MSKSQQWQDIMEGLRGQRLGIYDDIMEGRPVATADPKVQNIIGWLAYHRFVVKSEPRGTHLQARPIAEARAVWMREGNDAQAGNLLVHMTELPRETPEVTAATEASERANFPTGATDAPGEPAAVKVHERRPAQPELFP